MTQQINENHPNWLVRSLRWTWRFLVRLLLVIFVGGLLGAGAYFLGVPLLFRGPFQKIDDTAALVRVQATQQTITNEQLGDRLSALQERIVNLEVFRDSSNESENQLQIGLNDLVAGQATQQAIQSEAVQTLQAGLDEINENLDTLERSILEIEGQVAGVKATADARNAGLESALATQQSNVAALQELVDARGTPLESLYRELQVVRALASITRAALFIEQANFGLAEDEVVTAQDLLTTLLESAPETQSGVLGEVIDNLLAVSDSLPADPELASGRLEMAWQLLTRELSNLPPGLSQEGTPTEQPGEGTPIPTQTPTPQQ